MAEKSEYEFGRRTRVLRNGYFVRPRANEVHQSHLDWRAQMRKPEINETEEA